MKRYILVLNKWDVPEYESLENRFKKLADKDRAVWYKEAMNK